jgi:asparagine synthase (glutamine-hydrolysing)
MCGLVGVFHHARTAPVLLDVVDAMAKTIEHRGPDDRGSYLSPDRRVGFGFRRLSIVDLSGGAQPMEGLAGECLVFNGEIYNYPTLRARLEADGVRFRTRSDTEVILHLYERYGRSCVDHLEGMFAFAIWDSRKGELFFARDRFGEKPLYWSEFDGCFVFGSEIKALLAHPQVKRAVNATRLPAYLANLVVPAPETLYAGIHKLPPGGAGWCDARGVTTFRWWTPTYPQGTLDITLPEAAAEVQRLLDVSVERRLMSDVPVGVLLSGGLDSSALVALASRRQQMSSFCVGFPDDAGGDERLEARRLAEHFGTDHHEIVLDERDAIDFLPGVIHHQDEPLADPVCVPLHYVCKLAHDHGTKVVLAGEGADELFWGYSRSKAVVGRWPWIRRLLQLPKPLRSTMARALPPARKPAISDFLDGVVAWRPHPLHYPVGLTRYHRELVLGRREGRPLWEPGTPPMADPLQTLVHDTNEYEFGQRLPELLLMRIDRFSMANSVEARAPFLDTDLFDFVTRLPLHLKLQGGVTKIVEREAMRGVVPDWVIDRSKKGFPAPYEQWMANRMGGLFRQLMTQDGLRSHFDGRALAATVADLRPGTTQSSAGAPWVLWPILNFALWHRYWIEEEPLEPLLDEFLSRT